MKENNYELVKFEKTFENSAVSIPDSMKETSKKIWSLYVSDSENKKELAKTVALLKYQAEKSGFTFRDFIKVHFAGIYSDSTLYAYAQAAERFSGYSAEDKTDFSELWEIIPLSKLVIMKSLKRGKSNENTKFSVLHFIQTLGFHEFESKKANYTKWKMSIETLESRYKALLDANETEFAKDVKAEFDNLVNQEPVQYFMPDDIQEQSEFCYDLGLENLCLMPDSKLKQKVKLYNQYSDTEEPEKAEPEKEMAEPEKAKTTAEIISDILTMLDLLEKTAVKDGETLPKSAISKFKLAMQNRNK